MTTHPTPATGRVRTTDTGRQLVIERTFRASIDEVWATLTEPERFARWYGDLVGEAGPGQTVTVTMTAEDEIVPQPVRILECAPPHRLVVELGDQRPPWHLSVDLSETHGVTTLVFVHTLAAEVDATDVGPGWEYYADRLTAALDDGPLPDWEDDRYQDLLEPHYRDQ